MITLYHNYNDNYKDYWQLVIRIVRIVYIEINLFINSET